MELPPKNATDSSNPEGGSAYTYNLTAPNHTWRLPDELVEVSGNTWIDKDHLVLIEDLHPYLYLVKIDNENATLEKIIPFAKDDKEKVTKMSKHVDERAMTLLEQKRAMYKQVNFNLFTIRDIQFYF